MTTVSAHIQGFLELVEGVTPAKPRGVKIDSFAQIEKAAARARKANPDAPDFRRPPAVIETRSPEGFHFDPSKRLVLSDFDGVGW